MKESMMKKDKPLILISNDDGVDAKGIRELIEYLRPLGELLVMAPDGARSGMSCAITADKPVRYKLLSKAEGLSVYKCYETPSGCVKLALFRRASPWRRSSPSTATRRGSAGGGC